MPKIIAYSKTGTCQNCKFYEILFNERHCVSYGFNIDKQPERTFVCDRRDEIKLIAEKTQEAENDGKEQRA